MYSVNVPLQEGMDDESYKYVYEPVMQKVRGRDCTARVLPMHTACALSYCFCDSLVGCLAPLHSQSSGPSRHCFGGCGSGGRTEAAGLQQ
jgi:hypothetical protein